MMVNPYPIYRQLREEAPVFWSEQWKAWVVSRFDDVATSLKDKENLSNESRQGLLFAGLTVDERQQLCPLRHYFAQKDVIGSDPPDHTRMRALVQKAFTPKTINALEPRICELAESMIAPAIASGRFDFIARSRASVARRPHCRNARCTRRRPTSFQKMVVRYSRFSRHVPRDLRPGDDFPK